VSAGVAKRQTASTYLTRLAEIGVLTPMQVGRDKLFIHRGPPRPDHVGDPRGTGVPMTPSDVRARLIAVNVLLTDDDGEYFKAATGLDPGTSVAIRANDGVASERE
jgi:hypothetical protein